MVVTRDESGEPRRKRRCATSSASSFLKSGRRGGGGSARRAGVVAKVRRPAAPLAASARRIFGHARVARVEVDAAEIEAADRRGRAPPAVGVRKLCPTARAVACIEVGRTAILAAGRIETEREPASETRRRVDIRSFRAIRGVKRVKNSEHSLTGAAWPWLCFMTVIVVYTVSTLPAQGFGSEKVETVNVRLCSGGSRGERRTPRSGRFSRVTRSLPHDPTVSLCTRTVP